jgi:cold shock CspA family protein
LLLLLEFVVEGRIEILNVRKFGWIVAEGGEKYFMHASDLDVHFSGDLLGKRVEFEPADSDRGPVARGIRVQ